MNDDREYFAAFDVGGTKTEAVITDIKGHIVAYATDIGGNPLEMGMDFCVDHYSKILGRLFGSAGIGRAKTIYGSVACKEYFGEELPERLGKAFPNTDKMRIEGDGPCLISAMLGHKDGACMICGTGSSLYFRIGDDYFHIGGWGHLIDSCGSGYVLGRLAIQAAVRAHDDRGEQTVLCYLLEEKCGRPIWDNFIEIYKQGRPYIASFADTVFRARDLGDAAAVRIFNHCADELAELAYSAYRKMGKPFDLVLNGGIFAHFPEYAEAVKSGCPKQLNIIRSDAPPIYGCAVEALYDYGVICDPFFKNNFMKDYYGLTDAKKS